MEKKISYEILENPKLLRQLMEHSYWIKRLNRNSLNIKEFKKEMKVIYKERPTDKINGVIDGVDMLYSIIESVK